MMNNSICGCSAEIKKLKHKHNPYQHVYYFRWIVRVRDAALLYAAYNPFAQFNYENVYNKFVVVAVAVVSFLFQ